MIFLVKREFTYLTPLGLSHGEVRKTASRLG
jgi:hypothetical protein